MLIELMLQSFDLNLIHAKDGQESIDICKTNPDIGLVLMDIKMPRVDGHTAALQIKAMRPDLKIIAQSAYTLEQYLKQYGINPFDEFVSKPIIYDELKQKLMKYI